MQSFQWKVFILCSEISFSNLPVPEICKNPFEICQIHIQILMGQNKPSFIWQRSWKKSKKYTFGLKKAIQTIKQGNSEVCNARDCKDSWFIKYNTTRRTISLFQFAKWLRGGSSFLAERILPQSRRLSNVSTLLPFRPWCFSY